MPSGPDPHDSAENSPNDGRDNPPKRPHWVEIALGIALLVLTGFQITIYLRQTAIMEMQADLSRQYNQFNVSTQRAFVFKRGYKLVADKGAWDFKLAMENSGSIPVVFHLYTDAQYYSFASQQRNGLAMTCPYKFLGIRDTLKGGIIRVLGPHQINEEEPMRAPLTQKDIAENNGEFFAWGAFAYTDEATGAQRQTRFCNAIKLRGDPTKDGLSYDSLPTGTGNCVDEGCDEQDRSSR